MSLEFLSTGASGAANGGAPVARSPMERLARAAGGRVEVREGWNVVTDYGSSDREAVACRGSVAWIDVSHLGKLEVQASEADLPEIVGAASDGASTELGRATHAGGAWWCPLTRTRMLVICDQERLATLSGRLRDAAARASEPASVTDVTTMFAALNLVGPGAREVFARFCALDLRPHVTPVAGLRPGSVARQPGVVLREAEDRYLYLFGWAIGEYVWAVVEDAARQRGGRPAGIDAIPPLAELRPAGIEEASRA